MRNKLKDWQAVLFRGIPTRHVVIVLTLFGICILTARQNIYFVTLSVAILVGFLILMRELAAISENFGHVEVGPTTVKHVGANVHALSMLNQRFSNLNVVMTTWSLEPVNLQCLINTLDEKQPKRILEIGCGISTIVISAWLKENSQGTRFVSIDDSKLCVERTRRELYKLQLHSDAEIIVVPITTIECLGEQAHWYDPETIKSSIETIDLLLVDAPPAMYPLARLPAVPVLYECLSDSAVIILDDGNRLGERQAVARWLQTYEDLEAELFSSSSGLWLIRRITR